MVTTVGQLLVNKALPPEFRDETRVLGKGETDKLLAQIAKAHPDEYREITHRLVQLGRNAAYEEGTTLRLSSIQPVVDKSAVLARVEKEEARIDRDRTLTPEQKQDEREVLFHDAAEELKKATMDAALATDNPFALQVKSKARGNPDQLTGLLTTPGIYQDAKDNVIPLFIGRSYAQGLAPHEYWAATYGARKGVISSKFATRQAGALGKLFGMAVMDAVVTEDDCDTPFGIPVKVDDNDNVGSVLARKTGKFPAGTVVSKDVAAELQKAKYDEILVRSPITCGSKKGVCKQCVGIREGGDFPPVGYHIGLNSASALAEQIAQSSLNVKHSGKKAKGVGSYSGFNVIKNLATVPKTFPDRAILAETDGKVTKVEEAPQGGYYVTVGDQEHYVSADLPLTVKEGDEVEAGDQLSDGIVNPADVVRLKGVGEGRRYFADRLTQAFRETNFSVNRRNAEVLARSIVNHVQVDDPDAEGEHLPGDVVTYGSWAFGYRPRKDAKRLAPKAAIGQYLEEPALHYTVGTRVTRNVANTLQKFDTADVLTHAQPAGVSPVMMSVVKTPEFTDDWMARLSSTYLSKRLMEDVHSGATSNVHGVNPVPGIAKGTEFGQRKGKAFTY